MHTNNLQRNVFSFIIKSYKNLAIRISIKLLIDSRRKHFCQSLTMFAELVRNNFINDRVTVNSRERLSCTNIRQASVLYYKSTGRHLA